MNRLWDTVSGQELLVLASSTGSVNCVAFSPDGTMLAAAGQDGSLRIWETAKRLK